MTNFTTNTINDMYKNGKMYNYSKTIKKFKADAKYFFEKFKEQYGKFLSGVIIYKVDDLKREAEKFFVYIEKIFILENILLFLESIGAKKQGDFFWIE